MEMGWGIIKESEGGRVKLYHCKKVGGKCFNHIKFGVRGGAKRFHPFKTGEGV